MILFFTTNETCCSQQLTCPSSLKVDKNIEKNKKSSKKCKNNENDLKK